MRDTQPDFAFFQRFTLPIRHPSESWDPVPLTLYKSLDDSLRPLRGHPSDAFSALRATSSFRWNDERFSHAGNRCRNFPRTAAGFRTIPPNFRGLVRRLIVQFVLTRY